MCSYEPEIHPGATFRIKELKATLKIFQTGNITITAPSTDNIQQAVEAIYPLVYEFQKPKLKSDVDNPIPEVAKKKAKKRKRPSRPAQDLEEEPFQVSPEQQGNQGLPPRRSSIAPLKPGQMLSRKSSPSFHKVVRAFPISISRGQMEE